jgi:hypothetical protein
MDFAAVLFDYFPGIGQSKAQPPRFGGVKRLEDPIKVLGWKANASIGNLDNCAAGP